MLFELRCTRQLITVDRTELGRTGTEGVLFLIEKNNFTAFFKRRGYLHSVEFIPTLSGILAPRLAERL